jgi:hypothetical protein
VYPTSTSVPEIQGLFRVRPTRAHSQAVRVPSLFSAYRAARTPSPNRVGACARDGSNSSLHDLSLGIRSGDYTNVGPCWHWQADAPAAGLGSRPAPTAPLGGCSEPAYGSVRVGGARSACGEHERSPLRRAHLRHDGTAPRRLQQEQELPQMPDRLGNREATSGRRGAVRQAGICLPPLPAKLRVYACAGGACARVSQSAGIGPPVRAAVPSACDRPCRVLGLHLIGTHEWATSKLHADKEPSGQPNPSDSSMMVPTKVRITAQLRRRRQAGGQAEYERRARSRGVSTAPGLQKQCELPRMAERQATSDRRSAGRATHRIPAR